MPWAGALSAALGVSEGVAIAIGLVLAGGSVYYLQRQQKKAARDARNAFAANGANRLSREISFSQNPAAERSFGYGQFRAGGTLLFAHIPDENKDIMYLIVAYATHSTYDIKKVIINDETVEWDDMDTTGGSTGYYWPGTSDTQYGTKFKMWPRLSGDLTDGCPSLPLRFEDGMSGLITNNHRFDHIAFCAFKLQYDADVYSQGMPQISIIMERQDLSDIGSGTDKSYYSHIAIYDYLTNNVYGMGLDSSLLDASSFNSAGVVCADVPYDDTRARYECHVIFKTTEKPVDILDKLLDSCSGSLLYSNGKWRLKVGAWYTPTLPTVNEDDIRGSLSIQTKRPKNEIFNTITCVMADLETGQPKDAPPYTNSTYLAEDGQELSIDLALECITNPRQAQRISRMLMEQNRREITVSGRFGPKMLDALPGDNIKLSYARFGFVEKTFEVFEYRPLASEAGVMDVEITLIETDAGVFDDYATSDNASKGTINLPSGQDVAAPTNLSVTEEYRISGDVTENWVIFEWDAANAYFVQGYEIRYKKGSGEYINKGTQSGNKTEFILSDSGSYTFEVRAYNSLGAKSPWVQKVVTINGYVGKPDNLEFDTISSYSDNLYLYWTKDSTPIFSYTEIRLDTNWGTNSDQLLYRGKRTSLIMGTRALFELVGGRSVTVYGRHFNTTGIGSDTADDITLENETPEVPSFSIEMNGNTAILYIDVDSTVDPDVLGFRVYVATSLAGTYELAGEVPVNSPQFEFTIPYSDDAWDGVENLTRFFKVSAIDDLTDIVGDESLSTSSASSGVFQFIDTLGISVTAFTGANTLQLFRLEEWGYDDISLRAKIDFGSTTSYTQTVSLDADKWYSISWKVDSGDSTNPTLSFIIGSTQYEMDESTTALRFYVDTEQEVDFVIDGVSGNSVSEMMLNEGRYAYIYRLHTDDEPIAGRAQDQLNLITQQLGDALREIKGLSNRIDSDGVTIAEQQYALTLRVAKDGIASSLNLTPQGAKISGRHLVLDGLTRFINSSSIVYGEVISINGSTIQFTVGSLQSPSATGTFYQDGGNFSFTGASVATGGIWTATVSSGTAALGFFADGNIPTTTIDGGLITTNTISADAIISGSISVQQLAAAEIFAERFTVQGTNNIIIDEENGIIIFADSAVNTTTSTASSTTGMTIPSHGLAVGEWIKFLNGNNSGIVKKVTGVSGNDITFSAMEQAFDSQTVSVQMYKKSAGTYAQLTNSALVLVDGVSSTTAIDTSGVNWGAVAGTGKPADNATVGATWGSNISNEPSGLSDINSTEGTKLSGVEEGATKSRVFTQSTAPSSPTENDTWFDTVNIVYYKWNGSTWTTVANAYDNTSQLTDGASLGQTAAWSGVSGSGKPEDNATLGATWGSNIGNEPTELSDINSGEGGKLTNIEAEATKSRAFAQSSTPSSPTTNDIWYDTINLVLYKWDGSSWTLVGNAYDNTNQLTDGAGLGTTATWSGVSGTGKPADNATRNQTTISGSAPGSPVTGDFWYDTNVDYMKRYNGSTWEVWGKSPTYITSTKITATEVESPTISGASGVFSGTVTIGSVTDYIIIDGPNKTIKSSNFVAGTSGWMIDGNGDAQFNSVTTIKKTMSSSFLNGYYLDPYGVTGAPSPYYSWKLIFSGSPPYTDSVPCTRIRQVFKVDSTRIDSSSDVKNLFLTCTFVANEDDFTVDELSVGITMQYIGSPNYPGDEEFYEPFTSSFTKMDAGWNRSWFSRTADLGSIVSADFKSAVASHGLILVIPTVRIKTSNVYANPRYATSISFVMELRYLLDTNTI